MPGISAPNNTDPRGPKHLNMIEMAAPSNNIITKLLREFINNWREIPVSDSNPINFHYVINKTILILFFFLN